MRLVIVTGMSGAGKSTVLNQLEDAGYFCVDNLPAELLSKFVELSAASDEEGKDAKEGRNVAVGIDVRNRRSFDKLDLALSEVKALGVTYEILFLDASDETLIRRYKETRRTHPLAGDGRVEDGIRLERTKTQKIKDRADYIIDTTQLLTRDLKKEIDRVFVRGEKYLPLFITVLSFGFKYGIPADSDLVFDVRFLPNPYYIDELRHLTGEDRKVSDFLHSYRQTEEFLGRLKDMIDFLIPNYIAEGKHQLVLAIGCTGGRHRSVAVAREIYDRLAAEEGKNFGLRLVHRDLEKDAAGDR